MFLGDSFNDPEEINKKTSIPLSEATEESKIRTSENNSRSRARPEPARLDKETIDNIVNKKMYNIVDLPRGKGASSQVPKFRLKKKVSFKPSQLANLDS